MSSEFDLIQQYFSKPTHHTVLGVGDDAALVSAAAGMQLAISTDMLVAGTHFFNDAAPYGIGWKALAVNVSDMAAMGAQPKWATLAIALPEVIEPWLAEFSRGFFACADTFNVDLIGGDTTRANNKNGLTISVQIMGEVPSGQALKRSGAQAGDDIWVSGELGSAALGLAHLQGKIVLKNELDFCLNALHTPTPRTTLGLALRDIATSCIDISDGLLADLGHILKASNCGATLNLEKIPCNDYFKLDLSNTELQKMLLAGGDDYELCFTASKAKRDEIISLSKQLNLPISIIGSTHADIDLQVDYRNNKVELIKQGFDHFA